MNYGIIETESLKGTSLLDNLDITKTKLILPIESNDNHEWHMNLVEIADPLLRSTIALIESGLKDEWYAAIFNDQSIYIIFKNKTFQLPIYEMEKSEVYGKAKSYAISHGIQPIYADFSNNLIEYKTFANL